MSHVRSAMQFAIAGVALVIGLLAVSLTTAQKPENGAYAVISTWMLGLAVLVLGLTVVGTIWFYVSDVLLARRRKKTRTRLALFAQEGQTLLQSVYDASKANGSAPSQEADEWSGKVFEYLRDTPGLGPDFAVRFDTPQGLPMGLTTLMPPYSRVQSFVESRIARLSEVMQALGEASLQGD